MVSFPAILKLVRFLDLLHLSTRATYRLVTQHLRMSVRLLFLLDSSTLPFASPSKSIELTENLQYLLKRSGRRPSTLNFVIFVSSVRVGSDQIRSLSCLASTSVTPDIFLLFACLAAFRPRSRFLGNSECALHSTILPLQTVFMYGMSLLESFCGPLEGSIAYLRESISDCSRRFIL